MASEYAISKQTLTGIADAIREKTETTATMTPGQMPAKIRSINGGGSGGVQSVEVTQIQSTGTKIASIDVDGTSTDLYAPNGGGGTVTDVQVNGTSVVTNGVANVPIATSGTLGAVKVGNNYGLKMTSGTAQINPATSTNIKAGENAWNPITSSKEHEAAFYGLAKAAGDSTQAASSNAVGTYTDEAKAAIQAMLGCGVEVVRLA